MTKRTLVWTILTVLGLAGILAALLGAFGTSRVVLGQGDLQARIDRALPRTAKDITVERVTVILDDDMMMLKVEAEGRKLGQPFSVVASARGRPRYDPDRGALFFEPDNVTIEDLTLRGSSGGDRVENRTGRLKDRLGEIVKDKAAAIDISAAKIAEQGIKLYLSTFPIYRVKEGAKGLVVRAVLRAVAIENSAGRHLLLVGTDISCCHLRIADARARGRSSAADPLPGVGPITHAHLEAAATEPRTKFDSS